MTPFWLVFLWACCVEVIQSEKIEIHYVQDNCVDANFIITDNIIRVDDFPPDYERSTKFDPHDYVERQRELRRKTTSGTSVKKSRKHIEIKGDERNVVKRYEFRKKNK